MQPQTRRGAHVDRAQSISRSQHSGRCRRRSAALNMPEHQRRVFRIRCAARSRAPVCWRCRPVWRDRTRPCPCPARRERRRRSQTSRPRPRPRSRSIVHARAAGESIRYLVDIERPLRNENRIGTALRFHCTARSSLHPAPCTSTTMTRLCASAIWHRGQSLRTQCCKPYRIRTYSRCPPGHCRSVFGTPTTFTPFSCSFWATDKRVIASNGD